MTNVPLSFLSALTTCLLLVAGASGSMSAQAAPSLDRSRADVAAAAVTPRSDSLAMRHDSSTASGAPIAEPRGPRHQPIALQPMVVSTPESADTPRVPEVGAGSSLALMGVGAAAIIIGLVVGGDGGTAIAVGGGALGLVGLYRYLR